MINPFVIGSIAEQQAIAAYAERSSWITACRNLGASHAALEAYEIEAFQYAYTTPYANSLVIAYLRRCAHNSLTAGQGMPESVEQALDRENRRELERLIGKLR